MFETENFIIILTHFCSFPLGISFYGNNKAQDGVEKFASGAKKIYNIFDLYKFKV